MAGEYDGFLSAGAGFDDSGFFDQPGADDGLLQFTAYGDGYDAFEEVQQGAGREWGGDGFFGDAFRATISTPPPRPGPSATSSVDYTVSIGDSLGEVGAGLLNEEIYTAPEPLTASNYTPHPHILAHQPEPPIDPHALYRPISTPHFLTSAEAAAHRRRSRIAPKSRAPDVARVKAFGRAYWVCRLYNAMIDRTQLTDSASSVHRTRFTRLRAFEPLDLEATAHAIFDEAIAVHERGWNRPKVYHKRAVRGRLVDVSETSLELRLSRICLVLRQTKSAVDDAVRGGLTLALLCDNPEARRSTKVANDEGNRKRGERLKMTAAKGRAVKVQKVEAEVEDEEQGEVGGEVPENPEVPEIQDEKVVVQKS